VPAQNNLHYLIIRNRSGKHTVSFIRFLVTDEDMRLLEPVLQRLMRKPYNQGLSFEIKDGDTAG